ncbi:non-glycosylated major envelope protein [Simian hemorrhagic fever virus]|uniref:M protein n=2 Tax=Simian hemorrhagic fever virus TaxID=38143 RepID=A0A077EP12_SHFV|nr:non-glycosylated major envelope protein [Simian hemorrhagic fever virus]AAB63398.1 non-glycosylated major envelope protein [Simian hemorrhagic fever virus]AIL48092.1 M protein [Simian hemorrhagic fever virus]AIL48107.1 M protein [Simian hemorrhagic fever virus]AIL48122.1 M protein [Simian hemorrhagic fever virus]AIL48137.1 M protein [Simian hemorrhagic fever virus]
MVVSLCSDPGYTTLAFTIAPALIAFLRYFRPSVRGFICLVCIATLAYAATAFNEHSLATLLTIGFSLVYLTYKFITWTILRVRMCWLGRQYITAPSSMVESSLGRLAINATGSTAVVTRRSGMTAVNGSLMPDVKRIILNGRVAAKRGLVNLRKYGWQTKNK